MELEAGAACQRSRNGLGTPHYFLASQSVQPSDQVAIRPPFAQTMSAFEEGLGSCQGGAFGFEINSQILTGGVYAGVTQPVGNGADVNSGTQKVDGCAVAPMPLAA